MKQQLFIIAALLLLFGSIFTDTPFHGSKAMAQEIDNGTGDNVTDDNVTDDNVTDDNETEDNETVKRLKELFANAHDNYSCQTPRDIIKFPVGTNLEKCVRENIGDNRWPIDCERAATVKSLSCNDEYISSVEGLQQFVNLETLIFAKKGTYIDNLSALRNLKKLIVLAVPNSFIIEIGYLANLKRLTTLDLSGNMITNLEFLPFISGLQTLALEYQAPDYITDITPIAPLLGLTTLSLQGNKITNIDAIANLKYLSTLSIRDNRIESLEPLRELKYITALNFSINKITDISPIDNLTRMQGLSGNHNKIPDIKAVDNMTNIRQLSFIQNLITDVSPLADKKKLISANLDYNKIENLLPIKDIMYYAVLGELGLAYNCIPYENYRQVRYLDTIQKLRLDHQCEPFPVYVPDNMTVVNGDLVNAGDIIDKDNITISRFEQTAGRGCSMAGAGKPDYTIAMLMILSIIILIYRRNRRKKLTITKHDAN